MKYSALVLALIVAGCRGAAEASPQAGTPAPVEGDQAALARSLARRGWFDLAEEQCLKIEKDSSTLPSIRASVPFIRAEILIGRADRERDVEKATGYIDRSIRLLQDLIKNQPGHTLVLNARINTGWLLGRKARVFTDSLDVETDATRRINHQERARETFAEAITFYKGTLDELRKATPTEDIEDAILDARLGLPKAMLGTAKIAGLDEVGRKKTLGEALKLLEDFEFDYGMRPVGFEGTMVAAQVLVLMGDANSWRQAEVKFGSAITLKSRLRENRLAENEYHKRIIYTSYIDLCQLYRATARPTECRETVDRVLGENPGIDTEWSGYLLRFEKVKALVALQDIDSAKAILEEILRTDNGRFKEQARVLLRRRP